MTVIEKLAHISGTGPVRRLAIELILSAPIERVWDAITQAEQLQKWWTGGLVEAEDGGRVILEDGSAVNGTVKCCRPPYVFEFTWNDDPENAVHPYLIDHLTNSVIRFDLVEMGDDTALTFTQYLPPGEIAGAAAGWHQIIGERLKSLLETGRVSDDHDQRIGELLKIYQTDVQ